MTIGFCKKLPLEINQNPDFCKFREKAKGTTFVFVQKTLKNVMYQGKIEFSLKIKKTLRTCRKTQNY